MKLKYIKADNIYYFPVGEKVQDPKCWEGIWKPVCFIKQLSGGKFQIDMWDSNSADWENGVGNEDKQTPNTKIILYPSGIQEIRYE